MFRHLGKLSRKYRPCRVGFGFHHVYHSSKAPNSAASGFRRILSYMLDSALVLRQVAPNVTLLTVYW